jgi:hypothetical protein
MSDTVQPMRHPGRASEIVLAVLGAVTVASLVFPLVTPFLAAAGATGAFVTFRQRQNALSIVLLSVFAALFLIGAGMDVSLISVSTSLTPPVPVAPPSG